MSAIVQVLTMTGLTTPMRRAVVFGAAGYGYQSFIKPSISYVGDQPRPFSLFADNDDDMATVFPWFAWPLAGAMLGGLFL